MVIPNLNLNRFMIFNTNEGCTEASEEDKLLYHWTQEDEELELVDKINDICLCDASVNVAEQLNTFERSSVDGDSGQRRRLSLIFEQTLVVILEVEPEQSIWMAAHVTVCSQSTTASVNSIPPSLIERILMNIYDRFCLLNRTFSMICDELEKSTSIGGDSGDRNNLKRIELRRICDNYFNQILPDIHLSSLVSNITSLYNYILYMELSPLTLMKVNSFTNHLICTDPSRLRHTLLIFNDQLLWSSLGKRDTQLLYNYMVSVLIRDSLKQELSKEVEKVRQIVTSMPIYIRNHDDDDDDQDKEHCDYNNKNNKLVQFYLTVFRTRNNMTLALLFDQPNLRELIEKCEMILTSDTRMGVIPLASLAQSVGKMFLKANPYPQAQTSLHSQSTPMTDHIFMDRLDVSMSWPTNGDFLSHNNKDLSSAKVAHETQPRRLRLVRYLVDLEPELDELEKSFENRLEEYYGKTLNDSWLTLTNSKYRIIFSLHHSRNFSLNEAQQSAMSIKSLFTRLHI